MLDLILQELKTYLVWKMEENAPKVLMLTSLTKHIWFGNGRESTHIIIDDIA